MAEGDEEVGHPTEAGVTTNLEVSQDKLNILFDSYKAALRGATSARQELDPMASGLSDREFNSRMRNQVKVDTQRQVLENVFDVLGLKSQADQLMEEESERAKQPPAF